MSEKAYVEKELLEIIKGVLREDEDLFYKGVYYALSFEERHAIKANLTNTDCGNCTNISCRVPHDEKVGVDKDGEAMGSKCFGWDNNEFIGRSKILKITDVRKLR